VLSARKIPTQCHSRTFALIQPVLYRDSYGNQMVPNAPKEYKTHQNISLWSNGVDQVCSLRKIPTRLRGTNFCTSSARFAPSFVTQPNGPKCTQIVRNAPKHQFRVQWGGWVRSVRKIPTRLHSRTFALFRLVLHRDS
jgi:hypothetical protein